MNTELKFDFVLDNWAQIEEMSFAGNKLLQVIGVLYRRVYAMHSDILFAQNDKQPILSVFFADHETHERGCFHLLLVSELLRKIINQCEKN